MKRKPTDAPTDARAREVNAEERLRRICARIRDGSSMDAACWREGIDPDAVRSTMRRHPEVRAQIEEARAVAEDARLARMNALIDEGRPTRGLEWQLQRLHPATYNPPDRVEVSGPDGGPVRSEVAEMTPEQIRERVEALRKKLEET